jgi:hypothetical protein
MTFSFFLGAHHADWLSSARVPLFVSRRTLARVRALPRASAPWALDSGGFTELSLHGGWQTTPRAYVEDVRRFSREIGSLLWASPQDWMCEPTMLARTGLSVRTHQRRTIANLLELRSLAPDLPFVPVLQGWTWGDYFDHVEAYERAGIDLRCEPLVGIGSVCRRQSTLRANLLLSQLAREGLRLHAFGFKKEGLRFVSDRLSSSDSMAWSLSARKNAPLPECAHRSCSNCIAYALTWRSELLSSLDRRPS